ncbi:MAG: beta strand repeat-containing protein [Gaiellaceae bacterium]
MRAARGIGIGQRRLLVLFIAAIATAATLSVGLMRATAATLQATTTTLSITDANTGSPVGSSLPSTQMVTLTATVTGTTSAPTGTIGFQTTTDGVNYTPMCDQGGACSWPVSPTGSLGSQGSVTLFLPVGTYDVQATFRGTNGSINSSSSRPGIPETVTAATVHNTSTTVVGNPNSITTGDSTTLTATVSTDDGSGIVPSGTVTFYATNGNTKTFIANGTLDANGQASFTSAAWGAQAYTIEADYLGRIFTDPQGNTVQVQTSSGTALLNVSAQTNPQVRTATTVVATPSPVRNDQVVHLVATIVQQGNSTLPGATLASDVTFTAVSQTGQAVIGTAVLVQNGAGTGTAVLDKGGWIPGTYTITAQYFGNIFFLGSSGSTSTLVVNQARPTVTTYIHDTLTYVGDNAQLSAQVLDSQSQQPVPAGEPVVLTANDTAGTGCIGITDPTGTATCQVQFPVAGTYTVTASYGGDTTFDPSTGNGQITVRQVPTNLTVTPSPSSVPTDASDTLSGHLTDARNGNPVSGRMLTLTLNHTETCTAGPTDANGNASCNVTISEGAGSYGVTDSFAGDGPKGRYLPSTGNNTLSVVDVMPTNWTYTGTTSVYAGQPATISFILRDNNGQIMGNRHVTLGFSGTNYSVTTDANGVATQAITAPATAANYTPTASYGGEPGYLTSTGTGTLVVNTIPTSLTYTGTTSAYGGTPVTIGFVLRDANGNVLPGKTVTLGLPDGGSFTATTNASGVISDSITAPTPAVNTTYTPTATFGGSLPYLASQGTGSLLVSVVPTNITYTGDTSVYAGQTAAISFVLEDSTTGNVLPNMPVTLTLPDGTHYSTTTDASGVGSKTVTAPSTTGSFPVSMSFGGQNQYLPSTGNGTLVVSTIPTAVTYVGDTTVMQGGSATLAAKLVDISGNPLANEGVTLTMATGETCSGITSATGVASCQVVVNEATTLPGSPYSIAISFGGDLPYLASAGTGAIAVTAPYAAPADGWCTTGGHRCESIIANPTVVSSTQLQVLYTDDSVLPTTPALAPTAVLDGARQLAVSVTPTSGVGAPPGAVSYVDTYGGSTATKNQDFVNIAVPAGLSPGNHTIRVFISDGDGDWDQWTWTINVGSNGSVGTVNPGPGPIDCSAKGAKCESLLADPAVVSSSQLSIVAMDDSAIPMAGVNAPSATLNGQALPLSVSATSGQPQNYVDNSGGSMATTYQALITINLPTLAAGDYTILVTSYDGDGDLDQWGWSITVSSNGTVTSNFNETSNSNNGGGTTSKSITSSISGSFSNAVAAGTTLWLSNTAKVTGLPTAGATITLTNQTVTIGTTTISLPNAEVDYSPDASTATTAWDPVNDEWDTVVPVKLGGNVFASAIGYLVPAGISKNAKVAWNATISSDTPGVTVAWQWAAAAYSSFNTDPSQLGIKPCDDPKASRYQSKDKAGTPESYKSYVTAGGTGGGGSNYTGKFTGATNVKF